MKSANPKDAVGEWFVPRPFFCLDTCLVLAIIRLIHPQRAQIEPSAPGAVQNHHTFLLGSYNRRIEFKRWSTRRFGVVVLSA